MRENSALKDIIEEMQTFQPKADLGTKFRRKMQIPAPLDQVYVVVTQLDENARPRFVFANGAITVGRKEDLEEKFEGCKLLPFEPELLDYFEVSYMRGSIGVVELRKKLLDVIRESVREDEWDEDEDNEFIDYAPADQYGQIINLYAICHSFHRVLPDLNRDLQRVDFDFENYYYYHEYDGNGDPQDMLGFQNWASKPFLGGYAGGDWEWPIYFIIYEDNGVIHGFIPEKGNFYNHQEDSAFGNNGDTDAQEMIILGVTTVEDMEFGWDDLREEIRNFLARK